MTTIRHLSCFNDHTIAIVRVQPPARAFPKPAPKRHRLFSHAAVLFVVFGATEGDGTAARAQDVTPDANALQEIVVTAEKRESTVLKTAISLTAVTGHDLQEQGITNFATLAQEIPGISMKTAGPGQTEFEMRGLASSGGESPTVGFYLDDTPVTPPAGSSNGKVVIDPNLYDLNRVEVLRGPQGTLYGAGSMGGTIKLLTNQPDLHTFAASAEGIASDTQGGSFNRGGNAMLNVPIVDDKVALRLVATDQYRSGWIDRIVLTNFPLEPNFSTQGSFTPGVGTIRGNVRSASIAQDFHNVNDVREEGFRAILLIKPIDALSIATTAFYQRIDQGGMDLYDNPPGTLAHYQPHDVAEPYSDNFDLLSTVIKFDFARAQLTSATSYWDRTSRQTQDGSEVWQDAFGEPTFTPDAHYIEIDKTRQFTQELRAASTSDGPLQWLIGGFYSKYAAEYEPAGIDQGFITQYGFNTANVYTAYEPRSPAARSVRPGVRTNSRTTGKLPRACVATPTTVPCRPPRPAFSGRRTGPPRPPLRVSIHRSPRLIHTDRRLPRLQHGRQGLPPRRSKRPGSAGALCECPCPTRANRGAASIILGQSMELRVGRESTARGRPLEY